MIAGSHKPRGYISGGTRWSWCVYQIQFMFNCVNYCVKKPTKAKKVKLWCFASPFNVFSVYRPPLHSTQRTRRTICPSRTWTNWSWRCSKSRRSEKRCTRYKRSLTGRGKTLRVHTHRVNTFSFSSTWMITCLRYRKQSERSNNCQKTSTAKIQLTSTEFLFFKVKS